MGPDDRTVGVIVVGTGIAGLTLWRRRAPRRVDRLLGAVDSAERVADVAASALG